MSVSRAYVRRLDAIYDVVSELTNQNVKRITPEEFVEKVSNRIAEVYKGKPRKSKVYDGGKARYIKTTIAIGKTLGLLRLTEDNMVEPIPMDEYTFNILAGIFLGNIKALGGLKKWENMKLVEEVYNYAQKDTLNVEEFINALLKTGWVVDNMPHTKFLRHIEKLIMELVKEGLAEILENGDIKIRIHKEVVPND